MKRKGSEITSYLPQDLEKKVDAYVIKRNEKIVFGLDIKYSKSKLVIDALNFYFREKK